MLMTLTLTQTPTFYCYFYLRYQIIIIIIGMVVATHARVLVQEELYKNNKILKKH